MSSLPLAVVFDLDGTLIDTAPDLTKALNWVLAREGHAIVPEQQVRHMVGKGARHLILQGISATGHLPPHISTDAEMSRLLSDFLAYYADHIADHSIAFPGVVDVLDQFTEAGVTMGVCTNKPEKLSHDLLLALGLDHYFKAVLGGDSLSVHKPDPQHLLKTIEAMAANPMSSVMVGDSISDVSAARAANVPIVGVSFGYTDIPIMALNPDVVIHSFTDLPQVLSQMFPAGATAARL